MWETRGGVEASVSSRVGLMGLFVPRIAVPRIADTVVIVVSVSTTVSSTVTTTVVKCIHVRGGTNGGFRSEEEVVGCG